jgi:hypothetical protein
MVLRHPGERAILLAVVGDFLHRKWKIQHVGLGGVLVQHNQLLTMQVWQGPQQHSIHQAEHRRVRSDPQCQRKNRRQRKAGIPRKHPQTVADILHQRFDPPAQPRVAAVVLELLRPAHHDRRLTAGIHAAHAASHVFLRLAFVVIAQFGFQFPLEPPAPEKKPENRSQPVHLYIPTIRATAPESRSQFSFSSTSCFRPRAVSS